MNIFKRILFSFAALFVLMGTAGFYVFEHSCKMDGVDQHLYIPMEHICQEEAEVESCCHSPSAQEENSDCCQDEVSVIQIDYNYFHSSIDYKFVVFPAFSLWTSPFGEERIEESSIISKKLIDPPNVLSGKDISIAHQVFRC
jgi:hypothetical protein